RDRLDTMTGVYRRGDELLARVRDDRRAGVGDERDRLPAFEPLEGLRNSPVLVVLVTGDLRCGQPVTGEEVSRSPCVLAQDDRGCRERVLGARREVVEVPDRRRDDEEAATRIRRHAAILPGRSLRDLRRAVVPRAVRRREEMLEVRP